MTIDKRTMTALVASVGKKKFAVTSWQQVSEAYRAMIDAAGIGSSQAPRCVIRTRTGHPVAHVSYNGRVWPGEHWKDGDKPIYDPI